MSPRPYDNAKREALAHETRTAIIDAAIEVIRESGVDAMSYAGIADRIGIATRTVYRHFPAADDLLRAAADKTIASFRPEGRTASDPRTPQSVAAFYARVHAFFAEDRANYELLFRIPTRDEGNVEQMLSQAFGPQLAQIPKAQRTAVKGLVELFLSPFAWEVLHTFWGLPRDRVTRACLAGVQAVLERMADEPGWLDPKKPLPPLFRPGGRGASR